MVLHRWQARVGTALVTMLGVTLVLLDLVDRQVRRFWSEHSLTADTAAGLLVVAVTVLVVDQAVRRRQVTVQSRAVAANAAIMLSQARRAVDAVLAVRDRDGDRSAAGDDVRAYLLILLVGAPALMQEPVARHFLEQGQILAAELGRILSPADVNTLPASAFAGGLDEATEQLRAAAAPLIAVFSAEERSAVIG